MDYAKRHLDPCNIKECKFCAPVNKIFSCCFGGRNTKGCYMANPEDIDTMIKFDYLGALVEIDEKFEKEKSEKIYDFEFDNHHYEIGDRAENQSECPHCGTATKGAWAINPDHCYTKDSVRGNQTFRFDGYKKLKNNQYAACFYCDCGKQFYYHVTEDMIKRKSMVFE